MQTKKNRAHGGETASPTPEKDCQKLIKGERKTFDKSIIPHIVTSVNSQVQNMGKMDKLRIARDNAEGAVSYTVNGVKFARCRVCGREHTIPRYWDFGRCKNYVCPKCGRSD